MPDRRIIVQFTALTFGIAYGVSGALVVLGRFGYSVHNSVQTPAEFLQNVPFAIYILSPAIASFVVLKHNGDVRSFKAWLSRVFHVRNSIWLYGYVVGVLALYFAIHLAVSGSTGSALPFYAFFLALPGNLIIGGLEEAGWIYVLQSRLDSALGYVRAALLMSGIWVLWHIPLFFIPGTNHAEGVIDFWMFNLQLVAFRFFYGAIYRISGMGGVFLCVLAHTMFNAASYTLAIPPTTWPGTLAANAAVVAFAGLAVATGRRAVPLIDSADG